MDRNTWIGLTAAALCLLFVWLVQPGTPTANPDVETLLKTTMDIHDEAMKEMAAMNRIGRMLKKETQTLDPDSPRADSIHHVVQAMKLAEEDMYTWMSLYEPPTDMPADKAMPYLEDQKAKISQNLADIQAAHEAGKRLLPH